MSADNDDFDINSYIDAPTAEMLSQQQKQAARADTQGVAYKMKDGLNKLRMLPARKGAGQAYFAIRQHWVEIPGDDGKPRNKPILCLAPTGQICPLCELASSLESDPSTNEAGRKMGSRPAFVYNVLDMMDPEGGPKVCFLPYEAHKPLADLWEAGENPCDYIDGPIFLIKREKRGRVTYTTTPTSQRFVPPIEVLKNLHDLTKYTTIPQLEYLEHTVGVLTGMLPATTQFNPAMTNQRPMLGSRAQGAGPAVAPPRKNLGSVVGNS